MGELFLSRKLGFLEHRGDFNGFIKTLHTAVPTFQAASHLDLYLRPFAMLLACISPEVRGAKRGVDQMGKDCKKYVEERYQALINGDPVREDFLTKVLQIHLERGEEIDLQLVDIQVEIFIPM